MKRRGTTSPRSPVRAAGLALIVGALTWALPASVAGQSLHLAELFAEQGRLGDARAEVMAWFEIRGDDATEDELQHALWLRGRFSEDRAAGLRDLERLVDQHPDGPYTAHALTWLADAAAERSDEAAEMAYRARVVEDFPESAPAERAREWLEARGLSVAEPDPPAPARLPAAADSVPATPVAADTVAPAELPADTVPADSVPAETVVPPPAAPLPVEVETPRDTTPLDTVPATPPPADPVVDSVPTEAVPTPAAAEVEEVPPGDPVPGAAEGGAFAVQIGAFRNADGAAGLVRELIDEGFDARLVQVPGSTLLRVRVGRFASLDDAGAELQRVRDGGYDGAVVNDARRETVVSR